MLRVLENKVKEKDKYPQTMIEIGGHTDVRGSEAYNQDLSKRRGQSVADELTRNGVSLPQSIRAWDMANPGTYHLNMP